MADFSRLKFAFFSECCFSASATFFFASKSSRHLHISAVSSSMDLLFVDVGVGHVRDPQELQGDRAAHNACAWR